MASDKTDDYHFRVTKEDKEKLIKIAKHRQRSQADTVRMLIREEHKRQEFARNLLTVDTENL